MSRGHTKQKREAENNSNVLIKEVSKMIHKYGRRFKSKSSTKNYIKGRIKSWNPIIKKAPTEKARKSASGFKNFWKKELRKLK